MIDLAHCKDFELGAITVRPSSRELVTAAGTVMIEPKMMQVLVTLAHADGGVVSRDDLVEQCWSGRIVGDDAVNRIIGKLRRIADGPAAGAFDVETVARIGHRLVRVSKPALATPTAPLGKPSRRLLVWLLPVAAAGMFLVARAPRRTPAAPAPAASAMPAAVTDLETRGLSAMFENTPEQTGEAIGYLRQATELAPRSAPVWGSLAMAYVLSLGWTPPAERAAVAARVRDAAAHALALDPKESRSIAALVSLEPTFGRWPAKEAALAAAIARARPDTGPLAFQRVQFLMAVGRNREALPIVERLVRESPLVPWIQATYIDLLATVGRLEDADRAAEKAYGLWPRDRLVWFTRFDLVAFNGQPERALALAQDRAGWPKQTAPDEIAAAARTAQALVSRNPTDIEAALSARSLDQAAAERRMRAAFALGRVDLGIESARQLYNLQVKAAPRTTMLPLVGLPANDDPPTASLFLPPITAYRDDARLRTLIGAIGLTRYLDQPGPSASSAPSPRQ